MPDHVHLLIEPKGTANISVIMKNIKRVFALHANQIMLSQPPNGNVEGDDIYRRLRTKSINDRYKTFKWNALLIDLLRRFNALHPNPMILPMFKWQKSFRDHIIRNANDYQRHIEYIRHNAIKHDLTTNEEDYPWMWIKGMERPQMSLGENEGILSRNTLLIS